MSHASNPWWYLSFCDPDLPKGTQFLGGCYVQAASLADAITASWEAGCNPGGEVKAVDIPIEVWAEFSPVTPEDCYRLLTREELGDAVNWNDGNDT